MLIPTAVAAAAIITSCCWLTILVVQKARPEAERLSRNGENVSAGVQNRRMSGIIPLPTLPQGRCPLALIKTTTPKNDSTTTPTMSFSTMSKIFTPRPPAS